MIDCLIYFRESLIRVAFQSLNLVVTDFLPIMLSPCLQIAVDVAAKFGLQTQELNISLTAIGLLVCIILVFDKLKKKYLISYRCCHSEKEACKEPLKIQ